MSDGHYLERAEDLIYIGQPDLTADEQEAVLGVLRRGWLTRGPECAAFEKEFCESVQASQALMVSSCTAALHLALLVQDIGPGDEVILPSLTFSATAHVVVQCGAKPVFAEIDPATYCLDPSHAESLITPRTRALMAVHFGGHPADLKRLRDIASRHGIALIEDAAHGLGGAIDGTPVGAAPSIACFSFYSTKNITTAEGGMLADPDPARLKRAERLSRHGMDTDAWVRQEGEAPVWRYVVDEIGYKYNANDLLAALGRIQLKRLQEMQQKRAQAWSFYQEMFSDDDRLAPPQTSFGMTHAMHLYLLRLCDECSADRDEVVTTLRSKGIGATVHYDPVHLQPVYQKRFGTRKGQLPVTEKIASRILSLPMHSRMTDQQANRVSIELLRIL